MIFIYITKYFKEKNLASPIIISCWRILSKTAFRLFLITFTEPGVRHYFNCFKLSLTSSIIYYWECYTQKTSADCATTKKLLVSLIKFLHKCILHSSWYHVIECSCLIMNDYINFSEFVQIQVTHSLQKIIPLMGFAIIPNHNHIIESILSVNIYYPTSL